MMGLADRQQEAQYAGCEKQSVSLLSASDPHKNDTQYTHTDTHTQADVTSVIKIIGTPRKSDREVQLQWNLEEGQRSAAAVAVDKPGRTVRNKCKPRS